MPTSANKFYVGGVEADKVFVGSTQVYAKQSSEPGLLAHFDFNDAGNTETFDKVSSRRMVLTDFQKVAGYNGQAISSTGAMAVGSVGESLLNRTGFTIAVRQLLTTTTATGPGGGVRLYAADGSTIIAQLLSRPQAVGSVNFSTVANARFGGVVTNASRNAAIAGAGLTAGQWYWMFMIYDGTNLSTFVNNIQWNSVTAPAPPVDAASTSQVYVTSASASIDDIRFFDYAIDSTKRQQLIAE